MGGNLASHFEHGAQPNGTRATRARARREAMLRAACVATGERGRDNVRVADVLAVSGASRNSFYRQFSSAEQCLEIALAEIDERCRKAVEGALTSSCEPTAGHFEEAVIALVNLGTQEPDAFRAWAIDGFATATGRQRLDELRATLEPSARAALGTSDAPMPEPIVTAIVGGVVLTLQSRASRGQTASLPALLPELLGWAQSYRPPAVPLRLPGNAARALRSHAATSEGSPPRERIMIATTRSVAERGYADVRVKDVASCARVSLRTFYRHFDGLEAAFLSAVEHHEGRILRSAFAAYREQPTWPLAIDACVQALCHELAGDPTVARIVGVGPHGRGCNLRERAAQPSLALHAFLRTGYRHHPATRKFASEGVAATLAFAVHDRARTARADRIGEFAPMASFIALAPFLPVAEASRVAASGAGA